MKIDRNPQPSDIPSTGAASQTPPASGPLTPKPGAAGSGAGADAVSLSSGAQLAAEAARRIGDVGRDEQSVRPDAVERARAALADGTVGTDVHALADSLIDRMLDE